MLNGGGAGWWIYSQPHLCQYTILSLVLRCVFVLTLSLSKPQLQRLAKILTVSSAYSVLLMCSQHVCVLLSCQKLNKGDTLDHQREESEQQQDHSFGTLPLTMIAFYRHFNSNWKTFGLNFLVYLWLHPPPPLVVDCDMWPPWGGRTGCSCSGSGPTWNYVPGIKTKVVGE